MDYDGGALASCGHAHRTFFHSNFVQTPLRPLETKSGSTNMRWDRLQIQNGKRREKDSPYSNCCGSLYPTGLYRYFYSLLLIVVAPKATKTAIQLLLNSEYISNFPFFLFLTYSFHHPPPPLHLPFVFFFCCSISAINDSHDIPSNVRGR